MYQREGKHQPGSPPMEDLQSFVGDARHNGDEVPLCSQESIAKLAARCVDRVGMRHTQ